MATRLSAHDTRQSPPALTRCTVPAFTTNATGRFTPGHPLVAGRCRRGHRIRTRSAIGGSGRARSSIGSCCGNAQWTAKEPLSATLVAEGTGTQIPPSVQEGIQMSERSIVPPTLVVSALLIVAAACSWVLRIRCSDRPRRHNTAGVAFDGSGRLRVVKPSASTVVEYTAGQRAASGSHPPNVTLSADAGSLWSRRKTVRRTPRRDGLDYLGAWQASPRRTGFPPVVDRALTSADVFQLATVAAPCRADSPAGSPGRGRRKVPPRQSRVDTPRAAGGSDVRTPTSPPCCLVGHGATLLTWRARCSRAIYPLCVSYGRTPARHAVPVQTIPQPGGRLCGLGG
jgi:hypothetical protein